MATPLRRLSRRDYKAADADDAALLKEGLEVDILPDRRSPGPGLYPRDARGGALDYAPPLVVFLIVHRCRLPEN
jgi:hypothetical protein